MRVLFSIVLIAALFSSCKSSAQQSSKKNGKEGSYYEDLSLVRPKYEIVEDTTQDVDVIGSDSMSTVDLAVTRQIDSVITRVSKYNELHPPKISGYRVQIYNGGSQTKANESLEVARELLGEGIYGEAKWTSPVFRTRVGCFIDRLSAYKVYLKLQEDFPNALVVPDNNLTADCIH